MSELTLAKGRLVGPAHSFDIAIHGMMSMVVSVLLTYNLLTQYNLFFLQWSNTEQSIIYGTQARTYALKMR